VFLINILFLCNFYLINIKNLSIVLKELSGHVKDGDEYKIQYLNKNSSKINNMKLSLA